MEPIILRNQEQNPQSQQEPLRKHQTVHKEQNRRISHQENLRIQLITTDQRPDLQNCLSSRRHLLHAERLQQGQRRDQVGVSPTLWHSQTPKDQRFLWDNDLRVQELQFPSLTLDVKDQLLNKEHRPNIVSEQDSGGRWVGELSHWGVL